MDPIGHLVEYIEKNRVFLGMVQSAKKNRLGILTSGDRQVSLPQNRMLLFTAAAMGPDSPRDALVAYLREIDAKREGLVSQVEVEELWELVHAEDEPVPLKDLAELQFGAEAGDSHQGAVLRALFYQRLHFKLAGNSFVPLSAEQLEKKKDQQEKEEAHRKEVDQAVEWLKSAAKGPDQAGSPPENLLDLLRELVIFEEDAPKAKKTKEIVSLAELGGRRRLFGLLVRLGVFEPDENLALLKEGLSVSFEPRVTDQASQACKLTVNQDGREDLTGLYTFTIDGQFTTDFDDALSFEPNPDGGGTLGVHITDAAACIEPDGLLDAEAKFRGSTIYLPDTRVPMVPPSLSEDILSLREGQLRPAISTLVELDAKGEITNYRICRSMLKVHRRITYEEADQELASNLRLAGLLRFTDVLRAKRGEKGAYFLPLPEVIIGVDEERKVYVRRLDRDGPSREMVAETAIAANYLAARFLQENSVPALYRTQSPPREPIEEGDQGNLFLHFSQRRLLNRVEIVSKPGLHSSLGVEPYTHITSPIRRYLDLVMQRQMGAVLSGGRPFYTKEELEQITMEVQPSVRAGNRVRQARQRYWLLKWLEERKNELHQGLVTEYQTRRWQILITEIMMLTTIPNQPGLDLAPGQEVSLKIEKADAFNDQLRVSLA